VIARTSFPAIAVNIIEYSDHLGAEQAFCMKVADIGFTGLPTSDEFETWECGMSVLFYYLRLQIKTAKLTWEQLAAYPLISSLWQCLLHPNPPTFAGFRLSSKCL